MPSEIYTFKEGVTFDGSRDPETEEDKHIYRFGGKVVPSVSQILKSCRMISYDHVKEEVLKYKGEVGSKVHEYTVWLDQDELDIEDLKDYPMYYNRLRGYLEFTADFDFRADSQWTECPMAVKTNGMIYGMMPDRFGTSILGRTVVDLKTSATILPAYDLQTAGYAIPFKTEQEPFPKRLIVQLLEEKVNGKYYKLHEGTNIDDERKFLSCLSLVWWKINHKVEL